jgi:ribonuclease PH
LQGTGETRPFAPEELTAILELSSSGIQQVLESTRNALAQPLQ